MTNYSQKRRRPRRFITRTRARTDDARRQNFERPNAAASFYDEGYDVETGTGDRSAHRIRGTHPSAALLRRAGRPRGHGVWDSDVHAYTRGRTAYIIPATTVRACRCVIIIVAETFADAARISFAPLCVERTSVCSRISARGERRRVPNPLPGPLPACGYRSRSRFRLFGGFISRRILIDVAPVVNCDGGRRSARAITRARIERAPAGLKGVRRVICTAGVIVSCRYKLAITRFLLIYI